MLSQGSEVQPSKPEEHWRDLLSCYEPPHREGDWFGPLFWPLLQAASSYGALRGNYPSTALNAFIVYKDEQAWRARDEDLWPAIVVSSDGYYSVRAVPWSEGVSDLFVTTDPNAAASLLADLVRARIEQK